MIQSRTQSVVHDRQASILVCVLVAMAVAMALVVATVQSALQARREVRTQRDLRQMELVLEAGILRATRNLDSNADYGGETWTLSPSANTGFDSVRVEIEVTAQDGPEPRQVQAIARYPATGPTIIQRSYAFPINRVISFSEE